MDWLQKIPWGAIVILVLVCLVFGVKSSEPGAAGAHKMVGGYSIDYGPGVHGKDGWPEDSGTMISLKILEPKEGEVLADGEKVTVKFKLENYHLEVGGNHIHFIMDNQPYTAHYDENKPIVFEKLAPGTHVISAFPSRPWHVAWKNKDAFAVVTFHVQKKDAKAPLDYQKPYITFSRPKGVYEGNAAKFILLDYWLVGADLTPGGYKVRYTLDGKEFYMYHWIPVWWKGLSPGEHKVVLELLDKDGKVVDNGWNRTERTFTVK